jgi:hypothetical protein
MTRKNRRESLRESLSEVVRPPEPSPKLDAILGRYAVDSPVLKRPTDRSDPTQLNSTQVNSTQLTPVSPAKDFNKRANSIERDALPAGMFPGTSKKLYDALYLRTRGAVVPVRTIKATRTDLMRWASIGGLNTFLSHMKHLTQIGLIVRTFEVGDRNGAVYEVRVPEELDSTRLTSTRLNSRQLDSTRPDSQQKRVHDSTQIVSRVESSQDVDSKEASAKPKTSFKTNTEQSDDDEAFARLNARLRTAVKEITGREATAAEGERWEQLADLLITELKIAAGRTTVSSVPAFLTEHLRRRLWKKEKGQVEAETRPEGQGTRASAITGDISTCPDCFGTGMWYPDGFEKGVARCGHEKLRKDEGGNYGEKR